MVDLGGDRARLQRIAFGRAGTEAEKAAALDAQHQLAELDAAAASSPRAGGGLQFEPFDAANKDASEDLGGVANAADRSRPRLLPLFAALALGVVIGAIGMATFTAETSAPEPTPTGERIVDVDMLAELSAPADVSGAEGWLEMPAGPEDHFPETMAIQAGAALSARARATSPDTATARGALPNGPEDTLWIARTLDGNGFCLVTTDTIHNTSGGTCSSKTEFAATGLTVEHAGGLAHWDGDGVKLYKTKRAQ